MVQPRKEQIKDVLTRHSAFTYTPIISSAYTDILDATIDPYLISDTYGGLQEDVQATVLGTTVEPLAITAGDSLSIAVDGGLPISVLFAVTDTAVSRVANKINTAVGAIVAFNENGYLRLASTIVGLTSKLIIADVIAGTCAKLGISTGTYTGDVAPTRGVVTKSADFRGGFVRIKTTDEKSVLTDVPSLIQISEYNGVAPTVNQRYWKSDVQGGVPIYGRMTRTPTNTGYRISYYAKMPLEPEIITYNSDFTALDAFDSIDITLVYGSNTMGPINVAFSSPPYTRGSVIDTINAAFGFVSTGGGNEQASITGTVCQPHKFSTTPIITFSMKVDGGITQTFILDASHITTQNVVDQINASVTGVTASVATVNLNYYVKIVSNNTNGATSSLEFINDSWNSLGITPGLYRGGFIVEPYATSEIKFRGLGRGEEYGVTISASNPVSMVRMGLGSGVPITITGSNEGEQAVNFPDINSFTSTNNFPINVLIPEVLEFGEVDPAVESIIEQFNNKVIGNNQEGAYSNVTHTDSLSYPYGIPLSKGIKDVGKPVLINSLGEIDFNLMRPVYEEARRTFAQFIRGNFQLGFNTVDALVANQIETPGTNGNPKSKSATFTVFVDPDGLAVGNNSFWVNFHRDTTNVYPFGVQETTIHDNLDNVIYLDGSTGIYNETDPIRFADQNTMNAGTATGGPNTLPLSGTTDRYIRIFEKEANLLTPNLLKKVNAIWTVTVGNGTNSFGDFNGANAIQQAIAFYISSGSTADNIRIQCKNGSYTVNGAYGSIVIPVAASNCIIEGVGKNVTIRATDTTSPIINATNDLDIRDIKLQGKTGAGTVAIRSANSEVNISNCYIYEAQIEMTDPYSYNFEKSWFTNDSTASIIRVILSNGSSDGRCVARDCEFIISSGSWGKPVISVEALNSTIPVTTVSNILFDNCKLVLRSATDNGGMLSGNCGVIDLVPNGSCYNTGTGIKIEEINFHNCVVQANNSSSAISILIHLLPVNNGNIVTDDSTEFAYVNHIIIDGGKWTCPSRDTVFNPFTILGVENITVKNVTLGFNTSANFSYGGATGEVGYWANGADSTVPLFDWGAFAFCAADHLVLKNIKFENLSRINTIGDVFIRYLFMDISDIDMRSMYVNGTGSVPNQRVLFRPSAGNSVTAGGTIKNWYMSVSTVSAGQMHAANVILYEPSPNRVTFDNITIDGFRASDNLTGSNAFCIPNTFGWIASPYTSFVKETDNLTIKNSVFTSNYSGFYVYSTDSSQTIGRTVSYVGGIILHNNQIYRNIRYGILIESDVSNAKIGNITLSQNNINKNGSTLGLPGVFIASGNWGTNSWLTIVNNIVVENNLVNTQDQIHIYSLDKNIETMPRGMVTGNVVFPGTIQCNRISAGLAIAGLWDPTSPGDPTAGAYVSIVGLYTGYVSAASIIQWHHTTGTNMLANYGYLQTP